MRIQYNGESKILKRLAELVNQKADKSDIPAVGNGTLSVQRNGKSVGTFSANAAKDTTINIPVPEKVSELENDAGYTKNTGTYIKPSTGIPKSDLASGVQASLDKADTALQKHQDISGKVDNTAAGADSLLSKITNSWTATPTDNTYFIRKNPGGTDEFGLIKFLTLWEYIKGKIEFLGYTGTITGIKMNGASKGTSGVVDLGTVITAHQDISGKQDKSTAVTHTANTAVGSATKPVYIAANGAATPISHSINADVPANAKFTDTTYSDATQSAHGLMTAADKKKLDGMDLSKYLPLAGGVMTGDIDMATNGKDILVGAHRSAESVQPTAVAGGTVSKKLSFETGLPERKSLIGSWLDENSVWHNILSVRHRNGWNDGPNYGFYIRSLLTSNGSLFWNKQTGASTWQGERVLLDSVNFTNYAAEKDHLHAGLTNRQLIVNGANANPMWVRLGTLVSSGDFFSAVIRVWTGDGANGNVPQNASFEMQVKDGWQSTQSVSKACGVTVYRINCRDVKVKVIPTAHDTYTIWLYLPWGYWNGNYAVYGRYKTWTHDVLRQSTEPEGTAAGTAYYDQAFLTSTVAKANEATALTETAWTTVPATGAAETVYNSLKYLKSGNMVFVQGAIGFKAGLNTAICGTMPSGCLPDIEICFTGWDYASGVPAAYPIKLGKNGVITLLNPTSTAYWFTAGRLYHFNFCYHIG